MPSYAIGDLQGCLDPFKRLLEQIDFDPAADTLWLTGDLVNRGPRSLEVLRFVRSLGDRHRIVLGNHDLHLLALAENVREGASDDTLLPVLRAPDRDSLLTWLSHQPLMHYDPEAGFVMTHAGLPPQWTLEMAGALAREVEAALQGEQRQGYLQHLYGNHPDHWDPALLGWDRLRCITNYFTRMRLCWPDGRLVLEEGESAGALPWFEIDACEDRSCTILFGHWAALSGRTGRENVIALDTGCVWGYSLTAFRLEDRERFSVPCPR